MLVVLGLGRLRFLELFLHIVTINIIVNGFIVLHHHRISLSSVVVNNRWLSGARIVVSIVEAGLELWRLVKHGLGELVRLVLVEHS